MRLSIEDKLATNKYFVDEESAHIELETACTEVSEMRKLVNACPAGLYSIDDCTTTLVFDYAGCLECGTCKILGLGTTLSKWEYPAGSFGVEYRLG